MRPGSSSIFINAFLDLPQHVSASHCHHQGVVVSSEATQAICSVDVRVHVSCGDSLKEPNPLYMPGYIPRQLSLVSL
jgi:hypothetical protein